MTLTRNIRAPRLPNDNITVWKLTNNLQTRIFEPAADKRVLTSMCGSLNAILCLFPSGVGLRKKSFVVVCRWGNVLHGVTVNSTWAERRMGVTTELCVPLALGAMNMITESYWQNMARNVSINHVRKGFFLFNFSDINIDTIDCQWHSYGFWPLGWVTKMAAPYRNYELLKNRQYLLNFILVSAII